MLLVLVGSRDVRTPRLRLSLSHWAFCPLQHPCAGALRSSLGTCRGFHCRGFARFFASRRSLASSVSMALYMRAWLLRSRTGSPIVARFVTLVLALTLAHPHRSLPCSLPPSRSYWLVCSGSSRSHSGAARPAPGPHWCLLARWLPAPLVPLWGCTGALLHAGSVVRAR